MNNAAFNEVINELWAQTKAGDLPRPARFASIEQLTEAFIEQNGRRPDVGALDRLATLCLYEEVTDATPWKTRNTEYPIHSEEQRNQIGKNEVNFGQVNADKRHGKPTRRKRSDYENTVINREVIKRNAERKRKYREFTKVQPVVRWNGNTGEMYW